MEVAEDLGYLGDVKLEWVSNTTSGPQSIQSVATDQTDIGGAFTGAVIKLIEAGAPVQAVINYYGEDKETFTGYYVEEGSPIKTARDLIGKKIAVNTLGAHHEAVITTHLKNSGLTPEEIKQVQLVVVPPNETEVALRKKQVDVGTLGGVLQDRALAEGGIRALFTDVGVIGGPFDAGQYVLRKDFLAKNPETSRTAGHRGRQGHRVGAHHPAGAGHRQVRGNHRQARPQREHGGAEVLEERGRGLAGRPDPGHRTSPAGPTT